MVNKPIWLNNVKINKDKNKNYDDIEVDVLIIGGGIAGVSTAFNLNNSKKKVCLIDKSYIGLGVTSCSTGKLTFLQGDMLYKIEKAHGFNVAKKYYDATKTAINFVETTVKKYNIDCDLELVPSYLYVTDESEVNMFNKTLEFLSRVGEKYKFCDSVNFPFNIKKCIEVSNTAIFNPVKYVRGLMEVCNNIEFIENILAIDILKCDKCYIVKTSKNTIKAKKVIVATHYPFFITPGLVPFKTHVERSYISAFKNKKYKDISGINLKKPIFSIRSYKNEYVLYSSCSHKMSNHIDYESRYNEHINDTKFKFSDNIDYIWMTHDITTNDILPLIGEINADNKDLLIATGFNKWGMTNGTISGIILSDIVLKKKNAYEKFFEPSRGITITKVNNFIIDSINIAKIYLGTKLIKNHLFYKQNVYVKYINNELCGIYIDSNNKKHIVKNLCPHMKCNLIFNNFDKTWDCPCHGSRFDIDGNILEGPSNYNIKIDTDK